MFRVLLVKTFVEKAPIQVSKLSERGFGIKTRSNYANMIPETNLFDTHLLQIILAIYEQL